MLSAALSGSQARASATLAGIVSLSNKPRHSGLLLVSLLSPRFRDLSLFDATFSRYLASRSSSSKSWSEPRLLVMCAKWLLKSEPETWSWDDQVAKKVEPWDGVRNHQAANNMKAMKTGDLAFFYHSGKERRVMGIVQICKEYYPDPSDKSEKFGMVDVETVEAFPSPVTLRAIKEDSRLRHIALVRQSRLSVMPVDEAAWDIIKELGFRAPDLDENGDKEEKEGKEEGREAGRGDKGEKGEKGGGEISEGQESVQGGKKELEQFGHSEGGPKRRRKRN